MSQFIQLCVEAVVQRCSVKKVILEISQNSQENPCARVSFLVKLQAESCNFVKKEILAQLFSCGFCEISKSTFLYRTPLMAASVCEQLTSFVADIPNNFGTTLFKKKKRSNFYTHDTIVKKKVFLKVLFSKLFQSGQLLLKLAKGVITLQTCIACLLVSDISRSICQKVFYRKAILIF